MANGCLYKEKKLKSGAIVEKVEKGIWKVFSDVVYNQLNVDAYACTIVATAGALTSYTGIVIPYEVMANALTCMKNAGKFTPGIGAYLEDGVFYMVKEFNYWFKKNIKSKKIDLTTTNIINGFKSGSPVITGIKYGSGYLDDEQDNATIDNAKIGKVGHAIYICKINSMDDILIKYVESYHGKETKYGIYKDIILVDFLDNKGLFFNTGFILTNK